MLAAVAGLAFTLATLLKVCEEGCVREGGRHMSLTC